MTWQWFSHAVQVKYQTYQIIVGGAGYVQHRVGNDMIMLQFLSDKDVQDG